jgi:hypothetical protein
MEMEGKEGAGEVEEEEKEERSRGAQEGVRARRMAAPKREV